MTCSKNSLKLFENMIFLYLSLPRSSDFLDKVEGMFNRSEEKNE